MENGKKFYMRIEKVNLTKENLIKIQKIDKLFYKNNILDLNWYLKRYNEKHSAFFLTDDNGETVGYLVSVPIKKELYDAIVNGIMVNDLYVNPRMFVNRSSYNYVVSCVLLKEYQRRGYGSKMINELFNDAKKGKYVALTITNDGYYLAKKFMEHEKIIDDKTNVFVKDVNK